jgi:benzoyl-CoA reductase/2-hydroxyglutaryl-CoA dehydratase subunit BcrC/BadD/HgdB
MTAPARITLADWERRYPQLVAAGLAEPAYGGPLERWVCDGDLRLSKLTFDDSPAALRLWNFLLSEEDRLFAARENGTRIVGTMKDLGTVPILAYSLPDCIAFYPDGAWWIPCVMEMSAGLLDVADSVGLPDSFCPVRAMAGAFLTDGHFPDPDFVTSSVGAVCDDFSAIAMRLSSLGIPVHFWEMPARAGPEPTEAQVDFVAGELREIGRRLAEMTGTALTHDRLRDGIDKANGIRAILADLRREVFTAKPCPLPALELLIAEMLAIHYCSDRDETVEVLTGLLDEVRRRTASGAGVLPIDAARIFWVNPVADLRVMNLLEESGGRLCGTELLFCHALDPVPDDEDPYRALARAALADPMVGPTADRAARIAKDAVEFGAEAVLVSRIPGASHCAREGGVIAEIVGREVCIPVLELEVPPLSDALLPSLATRLEALVEAVHARRRRT